MIHRATVHDLAGASTARASRRAVDPHVRMRLLASSLAKRPITLVALPRGRVYTDGERIFVPDDLSTNDVARAILMQAALLGAGSLDHDIVKALERDARLARHYLLIEGTRVLRMLRQELPGIRDLAGALPDVDLSRTAMAPVESLELARAHRRLPAPPHWFGTIEPTLIMAAPRFDEVDGSSGGVGDAPIGAAGRDGDASTEVGTSHVGQSKWGEWVRALLGLSNEPELGPMDQPGAIDGMEFVHSRAIGPALHERPVLAPFPLRPPRSEHSPPVSRKALTYPEWDESQKRYRSDWCVVFERDPDLSNLVMKGIPPSDPVLRRSLSPLGTSLESARRQWHGDDLDLDALVECRVDVHAGQIPDGRVYLRSLRTRRDLAVLVLLDVSGSAGDASPAGGTVHDHQRMLVARVVSTLFELGDRVGLYGFRSRGRSSVELLRVKAFSEPFDAAALERLDALRPGDFTRLGAAIRHGTTVLDTQAGTMHRVLVVVSDGLAYDDGYDLRHGEADSHRALLEARRRGVAGLCLSVGAEAGDDRLRRIFGATTFATAARYEQLRGDLGFLIRAALSTAHHRPRHAVRSRQSSAHGPAQRSRSSHGVTA